MSNIERFPFCLIDIYENQYGEILDDYDAYDYYKKIYNKLENKSDNIKFDDLILNIEDNQIEKIKDKMDLHLNNLLSNNRVFKIKNSTKKE